MSQTFQFIAKRAKEQQQIIRKSQMSKQALFSSNTMDEKGTKCSYESTPQALRPIIFA